MYEHEKLVTGTFSGSFWDRGLMGSYLVCSHSTNLSVRWCDLQGVSRTQLDEAMSATERSIAEKVSSPFSLGYLLALYISDPVQRWLVANRRSMKDHIYPDDLKAIPIPKATSKQQAPFVKWVEQLQAKADRLRELRADGITITDAGRVTVPVAEWTRRVLQTDSTIESVTLYQASKLLFEFHAGHDSAPLLGAKADRDGRSIKVGKTVVAQVRDGVADAPTVASYLARMLAEVNGTFQSIAQQVRVPRDEAGVKRILAAVTASEKEALDLLTDRAAIRKKIDAAAWKLYGRAPAADESAATD
jgi:hypothetical protein